MGIRQWARDHSMKEPVAGTMKVTSVEQAGGAALVITGVVTAPGLAPTPAQREADVPIAKMRAVFAKYDLPVLVDRTDPRRLRFIWDEVPDERQIDLLEASRLADRMRAAGAGGVHAPTVDGAQGLPPEIADLAQQIADRVGQMFGGATETTVTGSVVWQEDEKP